MKKIVLFVIALAMAFAASAQAPYIYINDQRSSVEAVEKLKKEDIASMNNSVENGVHVVRVTLKEGVKVPETSAVSEAAPAVKPKKQESQPSAALQRFMTEQYNKSTLLRKGDMAADFKADRFEGDAVKLSDYRGKVVLLNFWATWCGPCLEELAPDGLPAVILEKFGSNPDFVFLPVAYTDSKETLEKFFATPNGQTIYNYLRTATLMDPDKSVFGLYARSGVPRSFVIDRDGRIVDGSLGNRASELERLAELIEGALKK